MVSSFSLMRASSSSAALSSRIASWAFIVLIDNRLSELFEHGIVQSGHARGCWIACVCNPRCDAGCTKDVPNGNDCVLPFIECVGDTGMQRGQGLRQWHSAPGWWPSASAHLAYTTDAQIHWHNPTNTPAPAIIGVKHTNSLITFVPFALS